MTNVLKPKTGTAAPTTSNIVDGEMAIDRSNQKLYLRDGVSIKEIGGGSSSTPTDITVADETSDTSCFPLFVTAATGDLGPKTGASLFTYNSNTGALAAASFTGTTAASTITGTTLKNTVVTSSLTTVGTIGSGVWQGTAIASGYIAGDAITGAKIADNAIDSEHYTDGSIDNAHIADNAIDSEHYADGSIDNAHIADNAIDSEHYADGSIDNAHIADDAIDSEHYAAGSIDTAHIADDQITLAKMAGITRGSIIYGNSSGNPAYLGIGSDNHVLTVNGSDINWEAASGGGGGGALDDLSDVTYSSGDLTISSLDTLIVDDFHLDSSGSIEINSEDGDISFTDGTQRLADILSTNYSIQNHGTINLWNETQDYYSGIAAGEGMNHNCTFYLPNTYTTAGYYLKALSVSGTTKVKLGWTAPPVADGTLRQVAHYTTASPGVLGGDAGLTFHSGTDSLVCGGTITSGTDQVCDVADIGQVLFGANDYCQGLSGGTMTFVSAPSDSRLKHERTSYGYGIAELKQLTPQYYKFNKTAYETANSEAGLHMPPDSHFDDLLVGLMAQDVEAIMPELVDEIADTGYKAINKDALIYTLINAVKDLEARIVTLEAE